MISEQRRMARPHILAVNTSAAFLATLRGVLQDEDYNVTTTNFEPRTFAQIAALDPAVVIITLAVGEQAGWEVLERLNSDTRTHHLPLLIVSASPLLLEQAEDWFGTDRIRYLAKPFAPEDLVATVCELLGPP